MTDKPVIGIDLGTTYSCVAICDDEGEIRVLHNPEDKPVTPSVIYFTGEGEEPLVGDEAKAMMALGELDSVAFFKREMGNPSYTFESHNQSYTAEDLSAILLRYLKQYAEQRLKSDVEDAVITVPAYFEDGARNRTIRAAEKAGLNVLEIINEPTSAAIAYGVQKSSGGEQTLMIYDLGGGTFDVSIVRVSPSNIKVLATIGDHNLGGKDWDDRLLNYISTQFKGDFGSDIHDDSIAEYETLALCEKLKKELSTVESSKIKITFEGNTNTYVVTREMFENLTEDLIKQTEDLCNRSLVENLSPALSWNDIDGVLLVGGSTRMPMVTKLIERLTGKAPMKKVNVDEAVAIGAAIRGAQISASNKQETGWTLPSGPKKTLLLSLPSIRDVTGHSLGMVAENKNRSAYINQILIPRNSEIPVEKSEKVKLHVPPSGGETEVYMLQGESLEPLKCSILGKYVFSGIKRERANNPEVQIEISYSYNRNGVVVVSAYQPSNNNQLVLHKEPVPDDLSWLALPPPELKTQTKENIAVVLAIDGSGSMSGGRLKEASKAALALVNSIGLDCCSFGIVGFGDDVQVLQSLSQDQRTVEKSIKNFTNLYLGGTYGIPFKKAMKMMSGFNGKRFIVLLTDGEWFQPVKAIKEAKECKESGIQIFAVGIQGADWNFLKQIASTDTGAIMAGLSNLTETFTKIGQVMKG